MLRVSAKTGEGVDKLLDLICREVPAPVGDADAPGRAMIFDSVYDIYRGVITYIRVVDGFFRPRERIKMMSTGATHELLEIGVISPEPLPTKGLGVGEVGYLITGVKDVRQSRVGDTVTELARPAAEPLGTYEDPHPMVYSGLYPMDGSDYPLLRDALDRLRLNDAALVYEPETSAALGFGFRCGFLGLLHLEITRDRLEREFDLELISTAPNVVNRVVLEDGAEQVVTNPSDWPTGRKIADVHEPIVKAMIIAPSEYIGAIMELCQSRRGSLQGMDYLSETRVELRYTLPLGEIIFDFFDQLKSRTRGYASLDYEAAGEQVAELVKVDILLQGDTVDAFSAIVHKDKAYAYGVSMTTKLRKLIPRQQFEVPIQAAIGSRIIARESIRAIRKDVLAKCYGGDITRKRKLLEKQKEGKKRMKMVGRVEVPQEAFIAALSHRRGGRAGQALSSRARSLAALSVLAAEPELKMITAVPPCPDRGSIGAGLVAALSAGRSPGGFLCSLRRRRRSSWLLLLACAVLLVVVVRARLWVFKALAGVGVVALGMSTGVVAVNDYFGYYTSWSEAYAGTFGGATATKETIDTRQAGAAPMRSGRLLSVDLPGAASGINRRGLVYLPPQYGLRQYRTVRFPVVELMHGTPGSPASWTVEFDIARMIDTLLAQRAIGPMVVVMPDMTQGHSEQECLNYGAGAATTRTSPTMSSPTWSARSGSPTTGRNGRRSAIPPAVIARPTWPCVTVTTTAQSRRWTATTGPATARRSNGWPATRPHSARTTRSARRRAARPERCPCPSSGCRRAPGARTITPARRRS